MGWLGGMVFGWADLTLRRGEALSRAGNLAGARRRFRRSLRLSRSLRDAGNRRYGTARAHWRLSLVLGATGKLPQAVEHGRAAVSAWESSLAAEPGALWAVQYLARGCTDLAMFEVTAGDHEAGVAHARRAVELAERLVREDHREGRTELGTTRHNLAAALREGGHLTEAASAADAAVTLRRTLAGEPGHPQLAEWEHANSLLLRATIHLDAGRPGLAATDLTHAGRTAENLGLAGAVLRTGITKQRARLR